MKSPREQAELLARDLNLDNRDGAVDEIEAQLAAAHAAGRLEGAEAMRDRARAVAVDSYACTRQSEAKCACQNIADAIAMLPLAEGEVK